MVAGLEFTKMEATPYDRAKIHMDYMTPEGGLRHTMELRSIWIMGRPTGSCARRCSADPYGLFFLIKHHCSANPFIQHPMDSFQATSFGGMPVFSTHQLPNAHENVVASSLEHDPVVSRWIVYVPARGARVTVPCTAETSLAFTISLRNQLCGRL